MVSSTPLRQAARTVLLALAVLSPIGGLAAEGAALGVIVGYKPHADELARDETDRGPWADKPQRAQAAWARAVKRSREQAQRLAKETGVSIKGVGEAGRAALLRFDRPLKGATLENALRRLRLHPDVQWVEPDVLVPRLQVSPNDPLFAGQWHLQVDALGNEAGLNLPSAWSVTAGSNITLAVVDSGIRRDHPDFADLNLAPNPRLLNGHDFVSEVDVANDGNGRDTDPSDPGDWLTAGEANDVNSIFYRCTWDGSSSPPYPAQNSSWHGTFIAGQLAAATDNALGVAGLNWQARILPVRVAGKCGALLSDLIDGVRWAGGLPVQGAPLNTRPAKVINLSFGGDRACTPAYQSTIDDLNDAGVLLVVAAGNADGPLTRPADCQGVMAVGSVRRDGAKADYSSFGTNVSIWAPGGSNAETPLAVHRIRSTDNPGTTNPIPYPGMPDHQAYGYKSGTSFAAPQAVGVASLMLAVNPNLTPADLIFRMQEAARPHAMSGLPVCGPAGAGACRCTSATCGGGLLDAAASVQLANGPAAIIRPIGEVLPGARITLDGSSSRSLPGSPPIQTYAWTQLSGPPLAIGDDNQSIATTTLPAVEGRWVFQLNVSDGTLDGADRVTVTAAYPPSSGGGGGSWGGLWGLLLWAWLGGLGAALRLRPVR